MRMFQGVMKPLARLMIVYMLGLGIQLPAAQAAMVSTQAAVSAQQLEDQRDRIRALFQRDDVRQALIQQGVDPAQAQQRVDQLTDAEVQQIA
ncbi:MAG: PA2779 family protein, partial [Gammaproteobacteria bacterium]|nr:PA2779 family protein [Gammaproteobacteria bacterium]NIT64772.1 PA2779 family protein [Gammaproteobacteria bacterium]NIV21743.1 PA2779 family protein [Gammaproteobacteria bacterium]NIY33352.1 PA2779 family protein [Gammaproteobacteria bacterium]